MTNSPDESTTVAAILAKSPSLGLMIPEDTSFQHWLAVGKHLALADNALAWRVGDWWIYGEHRYGDRIAVLRRGGWSGPGFGACRNYATVARAFETSRRRDVLSFSHHREVALLSPEDADRWLDWAEQPLRDSGKPRSTRELRRQIRDQNPARRRDLNGSQTTSADVTDAISEGRRKLDSPGQTEPLQGLTLLAPAAAWREDSPNILPVPAGPPPDPDRVAIARAALDALDLDQRAKLFLQYPVEVLRAYARLTRPAASAH